MLARITDDLVAHGYSIHPDLASPARCAALRERALERERQGELRLAAIGRAEERHIDPEVRSDRIAWLGREAPIEAEHLGALDELAGHLCRELYLGLRDHEAHFALFGPGAFYRRHLDRFRRRGARVISTVLYLNEAWPADAGGELRIFEPGRPEHVAAEVSPRAGTLVVFLSDRVWHEVLPTARTRLSVAGWLREATLL
ncbi:MAG: 2OG-Fe(II) oxygenase [Myxococcales bacterium]|nr:2OG-Fe(II) oxygenase [Myxococcales bacterium]MCB9700381.1 2OG-Fe(II) oxygenase [Myxococcales bacterium]